MRLRSAAATEIGRAREENEDRYLHLPLSAVFGVADGVGGLPHGAVAAETAIATIRDDVQAGRRSLAESFQRANQAVVQLGRRLNPSLGIASTLTCARLSSGRLEIAHLGDSRAYLWRGHRLQQLTVDHSVANDVRAREARGETGNWNGVRHSRALTRCVGMPGAPEIDVLEQPLQPQDWLLLLTDGITEAVTDREMAAALTTAEAPEPLLQSLIGLALDRGGLDNATGVIVVVDSV